jgi:hypothetical protein
LGGRLRLQLLDSTGDFGEHFFQVLRLAFELFDFLLAASGRVFERRRICCPATPSPNCDGRGRSR